jgi:APA family basic amino acid/polyamine antiporter
MAQTKLMTPFKAILICVNSMIGAGLFINPKPLTMLAGSFGFVGYVIAALILTPLIICVAELAALHPVAGGLYVYSHTHINAFAGFVSGWAYFVGKTTSVVVLIHKFVEYFQTRSFFLQGIPTLALDFGMLFTLVLLNVSGVSIGGRVQYLFTSLKAMPLLFAFCVGFFYFDPTNFKDILDVQNIIYTVPIAIFPLLGFEVICAVGNMIENAARNIKRIIITAFLIVASVNILFQITTYGILGHSLSSINEPLLGVGMRALAHYPMIPCVINGFVFASIIGACFSLLTSNCWNLHTIARFGHLPGGKILTKINSFNVPWVSLLLEASLGCLILAVTIDQVSLQNMSVFAQIVSYLTTTIAALFAVRAGYLKKLSWIVPLLAVGSCSFILGICINRLFTFGVSLPFILLIAVGFIAALVKKFRPSC